MKVPPIHRLQATVSGVALCRSLCPFSPNQTILHRSVAINTLTSLAAARGQHDFYKMEFGRRASDYGCRRFRGRCYGYIRLPDYYLQERESFRREAKSLERGMEVGSCHGVVGLLLYSAISYRLVTQ